MWKKRKPQKRFSGKWTKIYWAIPTILVTALIFIFFMSGLLTVTQVEIDSSQLNCTDETRIRNFANLFGQNFFLINSAKVEDNLKKNFFCIKSASISKNFPSKITIQTVSRQPAALLVALKEKEATLSSLIESIATPSAQQVQDSYIVDSEGVVFSKDTNQLNIPKIYIYDSKIVLGKRIESDLSNSLKILETVKTFGMEVAEGWTVDNIFIVLSSASGPKVIFSLNDKINLQLASLQLILDKAKIDFGELEFIDLRFDKPVVRFTPKK